MSNIPRTRYCGISNSVLMDRKVALTKIATYARKDGFGILECAVCNAINSIQMELNLRSGLFGDGAEA